uniref:Myotubularin phosphatase domain-containing protein n=1 Tax=Macrostomum lignano TaxID=282301 RepID=A0A1I8G7Q7_9PLAT
KRSGNELCNSITDTEIRHDNLDGIDRSVSGCYTHLLLRCRTLSAYAVTIPGDKLGQDVYQSLRSLSDLLTSRRAVEQRLCFQFVFRLPGCANGYPDSLIVPARVSDSQLAESAKHRIGGRLPVLAYLHPASRRFLLVGAGVANDNKRCPADLAVLAAALDISCRLAGGQRLFGCLVDTRSAKAAKAEGGIEPPQHYNQWRARYLDLPPVGDLLTSLCRLVGSLAAESLDAGLPRQFKKSESSSGGGSGAGSASSGAPHWMDALQRTLDAANQLAGLLDGPAAREFACVFLHGRTGRDYSLLLAALVQVMLCPLARQFDGFLAVIDRAFVQFSHPFHRRCARSALYSLQPQQQQSSQQQQQQQQ